jgi:Ca-activated chloride channel family protein
MVRAVFVALLVAVATAAAAPAPQTPVQGPTFRSRADLVSLFATVTDGQDQLVPDLPQDAFEVYDNGKRQSITLFSREVQPVSVILLLDRSGSMSDDWDLVRNAASEFVLRMLPGDKARIGSFSDQIVIAPDHFTEDRVELERVLHSEPQAIGASPIWTATDRAVTALLAQGGRRVVLLMTDGQDSPAPGQVHTDVKDVMYRAQYDEIMVYTIGFSTTGIQMGHSRMPSGRRGSPFGRGGGGSVQLSTKTLKPDPLLKALADESGGRYFALDPEVNLGSLFTRIADELHRQYWLGFVPTKLDGDVHKLEVKVKSGLNVRARKSYVAVR